MYSARLYCSSGTLVLSNYAHLKFEIFKETVGNLESESMQEPILHTLQEKDRDMIMHTIIFVL
jgi:hypothetical protein